MKTIKFIAYLFYRYYSTGPTSEIRYFSTLCAMVMLFYIHLFQILILLNATYLIPTDSSQAKISNWFKMALFLLPIFLLVGLLIRESELKGMTYEKEKMRTGYIWLVIYIVVSFAILILLILYKRGKL
jgi:hypothetical protein